MKFDNCIFKEGEEEVIECLKGLDEALLIAGKGFDPRATKGLECIRTEIKNLSVCVIDYEDKGINENKLHVSRSEDNIARMEELCKGMDYEIKKVPQYSRQESTKVLVIYENLREKFNSEYIKNYEAIIIDISAMPRAVMFSLIKHMIKIKNDKQKIYILVCENSEWDEKIKPVIIEESAEYLQGFNTFSMMQENTETQTIWLPMLGMNEENAFSIIYDFLNPVEVCPVVPFPSMDICRGEKLLRAHGEELFRVHGVDKRNIIYVPEYQPILVYQKLFNTVQYYQKALTRDEQDEDEYKYAFSSQSSKLMDLGMLLVILSLEETDIKAGIVVVGHEGYSPNDDYDENNNKLYCLCLDDEKFGW